MERIFWAFPLAFALSFGFTPLMRWLAEKFHFFYQPTATSVNRAPVPLLGGLAIFLSFVISVLFMGDPSPKDISILVSGSIIFFVGLIDDIFRISSKGQLFGIFLASSIVVGYGVRIQFFTSPLGTEVLWLEALSIPVSILWIAAITASVKVMDGLDGLAAGICSISALTLFFVAWSNNFLSFGSPTTLITLLALGGSALGFLPFNFHPAKIFMGEAGAMFLGFILANMTIEGMVKRSSIISLSIPIAVLGIPIFNIIFAIIRRGLRGKKILQADREHIHDVLLKRGIHHRNAVLVLYGISIILGITSYFMSRVSPIVTILIWGVLVIGLSIGAWKIGLINPKD